MTFPTFDDRLNRLIQIAQRRMLLLPDHYCRFLGFMRPRSVTTVYSLEPPVSVSFGGRDAYWQAFDKLALRYVDKWLDRESLTDVAPRNTIGVCKHSTKATRADHLTAVFDEAVAEAKGDRTKALALIYKWANDQSRGLIGATAVRAIKHATGTMSSGAVGDRLGRAIKRYK